MNKKVTALVCAALLLVTMLVPMAALASATPTYAYVYTANLGPLNLRADTSTSSALIGRIPYGRQVTVLDYYNNNTWVGVEYNGRQGYVMARYLVYSPPAPIPTSNPGTGSSNLLNMFDGFQYTNYYVAVRPSSPGGFVHLRWAPSQQMGIMTDYYDSKQLEVLAQNNTWAQVRDADTGRTGFMMRAFLREIAVGYTGDGAAQ